MGCLSFSLPKGRLGMRGETAGLGAEEGWAGQRQRTVSAWKGVRDGAHETMAAIPEERR